MASPPGCRWTWSLGLTLLFLCLNLQGERESALSLVLSPYKETRATGPEPHVYNLILLPPSRLCRQIQSHADSGFHMWIGERGVGSVHNTSTYGHLMRRTDSLERPWSWERLRAGEGDDRGWDGGMASPTQWTWVWPNSGSWLLCCSPWGHKKSDMTEQHGHLCCVLFCLHNLTSGLQRFTSIPHTKYIHSILRPQKFQTIPESIQSPKFHQLSSPKYHHQWVMSKTLGILYPGAEFITIVNLWN